MYKMCMLEGTDWNMVYGLNNKLGKCRIPIDTMLSWECVYGN